jgi:hypothetical protein
MHYLLKPLVRALRTMNDRALVASIILGLLIFVAGVLDLLGIMCSSHYLTCQTV